MTITWKQLAQAVLTGSAASVYIVPSNTSAAVHTAQFWNPTGTAVACKIWLVPIAGSATDGTTNDVVVVPAASSATSFGTINSKLSAGQQIFAAGTGVTLTITGAESAGT